MADVFRTMIVPQQNVALAREIGASYGPGGENMWVTPLSSNGGDPASHYVSSGYIPEEFALLAPLQIWTVDQEGNWVLLSTEPGDPVAVYQSAIAAGVSCTQAQINALFAATDSTEQGPFVAMSRLGLVLVESGDL